MNKKPYHLAIIIDGNRRWAQKKKIASFLGHKKGSEKVSEIGEYSLKKGIKILTIFAFSTENWKRTKKEINYLMKLLGDSLNFKEYNKRGVQFKVIGQKERLPEKLQAKIRLVEDKTKNNKKGIFNLAVSYGGRAEIVSAVEKIIKNKTTEIDEETIQKNLWTSSMPNPDLIIRTGGECRLSNFLLWQAAYSEFYFTNKYWPDFTKKDLDRALMEYSKRSQRFGR